MQEEIGMAVGLTHQAISLRMQEIQNFVKLAKSLLSGGQTVEKVSKDQQNPDIADLSTRALWPLIREKNPLAREKAILHVENSLKRETPTGGQYTKSLTEKDIKKIVEVSNIPFSEKYLTNTKKSDHFAPLFPARIGQDLPLMPLWESRNKARRLTFGENGTSISCFCRFFPICLIYRCFLVSRQKITPTTNQKPNQTPILK